MRELTFESVRLKKENIRLSAGMQVCLFTLSLFFFLDCALITNSYAQERTSYDRADDFLLLNDEYGRMREENERLREQLSRQSAYGSSDDDLLAKDLQRAMSELSRLRLENDRLMEISNDMRSQMDRLRSDAGGHGGEDSTCMPSVKQLKSSNPCTQGGKTRQLLPTMYPSTA